MGRFLFAAAFLALLSGIPRCGAADMTSEESQHNPIFFDPCWDETLGHWDCSGGASFDSKTGHSDAPEGATKGAIRIEKKSGSSQSIRSKEHFPGGGRKELLPFGMDPGRGF